MLLAAVVLLTLGILYECATHVGRGWLRGEAFFDGRPTSYWRLRCDEWLDRFDTPEAAAPWAQSYLGFTFVKPGVESSPQLNVIVPMFGFLGFDAKPARPPNWWKQQWNALCGEKDHCYAPKVLWGIPDAEPVLRELNDQAKYRRFTVQALERAKLYVEIRQQLEKEGFQVIHEQHGFPRQ
ncbi:MAG: hypothetical protein HYX68_13400 [Planctomycetes bacterium]|nr:hypothetical protein [Planctomycetota bacterium]